MLRRTPAQAMDAQAKSLDFSCNHVEYLWREEAMLSRRGDADASRLVPLFFLYGEPRRRVDARFMHLEPLEARSRPTSWTIRAHSHVELHHVFLIAWGGGDMDADGGTVRFAAPCLLTVPARTVHGFRWRHETRGQVLTVSDAYMQDIFARIPEAAVLFTRANCLAGADARDIGRRLAMLARELASSAPGHAAAVDAHLLMLLVEALRLQRQMPGTMQPRPGRTAELVARFRSQLEATYRNGATAGQLAASLGVTPATLRRACTAAAGCPPVQIIQERLFLEAQRLLLYTNMTVSETAFHLGFEDSAYFSRFFTKQAGQSPRQFRAVSLKPGG